MRAIACWDCGFESRREAWMAVSYVCCVLSSRGLCVGPITIPGGPNDCGISKCDLGASIRRRSWPHWGDVRSRLLKLQFSKIIKINYLGVRITSSKDLTTEVRHQAINP
jgi:hypothetical protein